MVIKSRGLGHNLCYLDSTGADLPPKAKHFLKMQDARLVSDGVPYCAVVSSFVKLGKLERESYIAPRSSPLSEFAALKETKEDKQTASIAAANYRWSKQAQYIYFLKLEKKRDVNEFTSATMLCLCRRLERSIEIAKHVKELGPLSS
ncbi:hypothetical protein NC651_024143 [Populus alba x Populus x berolinensis]|nr:hypothetical protein NC651_024143 [Populus alba x Populus x berolinensis]